MYKILGSILILSASLLFSYLKVTESKERLENLKEIHKAFVILKSEISFFNSELSKAITLLTERLSGKVSIFFQKLSDCLEHDETLEFKAAWEQAEEDSELKNTFFPASYKIITDFVTEFGKSDREIELQNLDKTIDALEHELEEENVRYKTNRKLIYSLGFMGGISVMIFFI